MNKLILTAGLFAPFAALAWSGVHCTIAERAYALLPEADRALIGDEAEMREFVRHHALIPDTVDRPDGTERYVWDYCGTNRVDYSAAFGHYHLWKTAPEVSGFVRWHLERTVAALRERRIRDFACLAGCLSHALGDWTCPPHANDGDVHFIRYRRENPPPAGFDSFLAGRTMHQLLENVDLDLSDVDHVPRTLGETPAEAERGLADRAAAYHAEVRELIGPMAACAYAGDTNGLRRIQRTCAAYGVRLVADMLHTVCRLAANVALPPEFEGAKWIGQDAEAQPDWPVEGVSWLTLPNGGAERRFALAEVPTTATLAAAGFRRIEVLVNGAVVLRDVGEWFNPVNLRFADVASSLKPGENTITVRPVERAPGCDRGPTHGVFILTLDAGGVRIVSDGAWARAKVLSPAREIPFGRTFSFRREVRSPAFRKTFSVAAAPRKATLRITAPGFYEASLNGGRVGDRVLDPSPTDYDCRVYYSTYDVTGRIRPGENALEVVLGHGWYDCADDETWNFDRAPWRAAPRMIARLDCEGADGAVQTVVSDGTWEQVESPVVADNFRVGETGTGVRDGRTFGAAVEMTGPKGALEPEPHHPTKVVRELAPVGLERLADGAWRVTFGENVTGWVRSRLRGLARGATVTFVYDECLDEPRALGVFQRDVQTARYIAGGAAEETFAPRFTYYGFRFLTVRGLAEAPRKGDFTACVVRTSFPKTGRFTCSDADFNALFAATERSFEGNFTVGFPTDCPHREKNGWMADAAMAVEFGLLDYGMAADYRKWLQDIMDAQRPSGMIPAIVPTCGWGSFIFDGCGYGPVWDSAPYAVVHGLWRHCGDTASVRLAYDMLERHFAFAETQIDADGLVGKFNGDHAARNDLQPDNRYCCTAYHLFNAERLAELAEALGDARRSETCRAAATRLRRALVRHFYRGGGVWDDGRETAQALAVDLALAPPGEAAATAARLVRAVEAEDGHFSFGIVGSRHLLRALSKVGRTDLAFAGLVKKSEPSPLLWLKDGGGTLWETWDGKASRNHIMFGDFSAWAYAHLAGITPAAPGYSRIRFAPEPIPALAHVEASVATPRGTVGSSWRRDAKGAVTFEFDIPEGTTAEILLPGESPRTVGAGHFTFR